MLVPNSNESSPWRRSFTIVASQEVTKMTNPKCNLVISLISLLLKQFWVLLGEGYINCRKLFKILLRLSELRIDISKNCLDILNCV